MLEPRLAARAALPLLDLTDLSETSCEEAVARLCEKAVTAHGAVAAVCIYPRFVAQAKHRLAGSPVRIATVANFPHGGEDVPAAVAEAGAAAEDGADEIDLVMPWRAFLAGRRGFAETMILRVRQALPDRVSLKVILETGCLETPEAIRSAAALAVAAGADFLKTSTGKVAVNATPEAARILLEEARRADRAVGVKVAGGIRTLEEASAYLALAQDILGAGNVSARTFRIGASGLLDALLAAIGEEVAGTAGTAS